MFEVKKCPSFLSFLHHVAYDYGMNGILRRNLLKYGKLARLKENMALMLLSLVLCLFLLVLVCAAHCLNEDFCSVEAKMSSEREGRNWLPRL